MLFKWVGAHLQLNRSLHYRCPLMQTLGMPKGRQNGEQYRGRLCAVIEAQAQNTKESCPNNGYHGKRRALNSEFPVRIQIRTNGATKCGHSDGDKGLTCLTGLHY